MWSVAEDTVAAQHAAPQTFEAVGADGAVPVDGMPPGFGRSVAWVYAATAAAALSGVALTPLLLDRLGVAAFGVWALAGSTIQYLELLEMGFGVSTTKLVAEDARSRPDRVLATLNTSFWLLACLGVVAGAVGVAMAYLAPQWFSVPGTLADETRLVFLALAASLCISIPADTLGGALAGYQRFDLVGRANLVMALAAGGAGAVAVLAGGGLVALSVATAVALIASHALRWVYLKRVLPELRLSPRLIERGRARSTARLSGWFLLRDLAITLIQKIDLLVVGVLVGLRGAAAFAVGAKLAQLLRKGLLPVAQAFFPHASDLASQGDQAGLRAAVGDGARVSMLIGVPTAIVLAILAHPAVEAWVGPDFGVAAVVLIWLAVATGIASVSATAWHVLGGVGHARLAGLLAAGEAAVNLGLSVALARRFGPSGVAFATLVGVVVIELPFVVPLSCRATGVRVPAFLRQAVVPHVVPAACVTAVLLFVRPFVPAAVLPVLVVGAVAWAAYVGLYLVVGATPLERERARALARRLRPAVPSAGR